MISSDDDNDDDGGIFDQGSVVSSTEAEVDEVASSPKRRSLASIFSSRSSNSFPKEDALAEELARKTRIETILRHETNLGINLRSAQAFRISKEMLARQEHDIHEAFAEVDYLRAELAEIVPNKVIPAYKKRILAKYITANRKEIAARQHYATIVLSAAMADAAAFRSNEEWKNRVENDLLVKQESKIIKSDKNLNKQLVLRKKHEYDYNRTKAILKADYNALQAAWPGVDYSSLLAPVEHQDRKHSIQREIRARRPVSEFCPPELYPK